MDADDDNGAPPCDVCNENAAALWCDTCSVMLCESSECRGPHTDHHVGAIGTEEDGAEEGRFVEEITEEAAFHLMDMLDSSAHLVCRRLLSQRVAAWAEDAHPASARRGATLQTRHELAPVTVDASQHLTGNKPSLPQEAWAMLGAYSYVVLDGIVPAELAAAARRQTLGLVESGALTQYVNPTDVGRDTRARGDLRAFLRPDEAGDAACDDDDDSDEAVDEAEAAAQARPGEQGTLSHLRGPLLGVLRRLKRLGRAIASHVALEQPHDVQEYQLAFYGNQGERYEKHRDAMPNDGARPLRGQVGRRVTATCYLNEAWVPAHGGELRLHVPVSADARQLLAVDVPPVTGRVVLFLSGAMDHEVLPSQHPRCAFAAWYS